MKAIVIEAPFRVSAVDIDRQTPKAGEVCIAVDLVGICATDIHILSGHFPTASYPLTPGHEVTGTVVEVGPDVSMLAIGTQIVVDPGIPCETCILCRDGRPNLCENRNAIGITRAGGAADYLTLPAVNCHPVPPGIPLRAAVLAEPLACVVHAFDLVRPPAGENVLIYGAGTMGLLAVQVAHHLGAASVSVVELSKPRTARAIQIGAVAASASADDLVPATGWGLVIDATGAPSAISDGLSRVRRGGTFLQIGVAAPDHTVELAPYELFSRELTVVGSMTTRNSFPRALTMLGTGAIDSSLITGEPLALSGFAHAIELAQSGEIPKVVVSPQPGVSLSEQ